MKKPINIRHNKLAFPLAALIVTLIFISGTKPGSINDDDWAAPKSADLLKNPYKGKAEATAEGKKLYIKLCKICHGDKGKGDGIAGLSLKPRPKDFTSEKVQSQTDGAIFWKLTTGKSPMAAYEKILKKEQRWKLVNYIRVLGKK